MDEISRAKITKNREFLCENTSLLRDIIKHLNNYDMFSAKEEFDILNGSDDAEDQLGDFYDLILRKGKHAYGRLIEALRATQNNTILQRLEGNDQESSSQSAGTPQPIITERLYQKLLRKSLPQCCNKTGNLLQLLSALHAEEIISKHEMSVIVRKDLMNRYYLLRKTPNFHSYLLLYLIFGMRSKPTEFEQNSELFGMILPKRGPEKFGALLECLRESENHYVENLLINLQKEIGP